MGGCGCNPHRALSRGRPPQPPAPRQSCHTPPCASFCDSCCEPGAAARHMDGGGTTWPRGEPFLHFFELGWAGFLGCSLARVRSPRSESHPAGLVPLAWTPRGGPPRVPPTTLRVSASPKRPCRPRRRPGTLRLAYVLCGLFTPFQGFEKIGQDPLGDAPPSHGEPPPLHPRAPQQRLGRFRACEAPPSLWHSPERNGASAGPGDPTPGRLPCESRIFFGEGAALGKPRVTFVEGVSLYLQYDDEYEGNGEKACWSLVPRTRRSRSPLL